MWKYVVRRLLYNVPVYLGIILLVMAALRINDPVYNYLGKNATAEDVANLRSEMGLDQSFAQQYFLFLKNVFTLNFESESWANPGVEVGTMLKEAIVPSLSITLPALCFTTLTSVCIGLVCANYRGRWPDRLLAISAVLGMSISLLVYTILGQYFGAFKLAQLYGGQIFAIEGYEFGLGSWGYYCLLPVMISSIVALGYDARFYRAVMVEETGEDYIVTARAKGATRPKILFVHMLKNALIPITTHIASTIPFLITGSIVLEMYFNIPGMGRGLIQAVTNNDFPVVQTFTAVLAALYIVSNILTDVVYAWVDPRVRLS